MPRSDKGYPLAGYGAMISDKTRLECYVAAMKECITSESTVIDLGAGPGIFALLACQLGAKKVIAIEPHPSIRILPKLAQLNGFSDKIEVIQSMSTAVELIEKADVIVSDLRSVLPLYTYHIPSLQDAKNRLLATNGVLIPRRDKVYTAPVTAAALYNRIVAPWTMRLPGLDLSEITRLECNKMIKANLTKDQLAAEPTESMRLDYHSEQRATQQGPLMGKIKKDCLIHGILAWFDSDLTENISFSNHPAAKSMIYGQAFFPFQQPINVSKGMELEGQLKAIWIDGQYLWQWQGRIIESAGTVARFNQSTFGTKLRFAALDNTRNTLQ